MDVQKDVSLSITRFWGKALYSDYKDFYCQV